MLQRTRRLLSCSLAAISMLLLFLSPGPAVHAQYNRGNFYNGARDGGRGGYYDHSGYRDGRYNRDYGYNNNNDGRYHGHGIGTGRGALIGGGIGAVAGAAFGGGAKGALIAGGLGAGIGAFAGHEHQKSMRRRHYERQDGYYR